VILRLAAGLALALGLVALAGYLHALGKGPWATLEAGHLREMKDRLDPPGSVEAFAFADFAALPRGRPVAEYSAIEARGASLEGYVQWLIRSPDGDLHVELVGERRDAASPDTAYVTAEITPQWQRGDPGWGFQRVAPALRPQHATGLPDQPWHMDASGSAPPWEGGPRRVRLSGWLLYDYQHDTLYGVAVPGRFGAGTTVSQRLSGWEIHPVTRIEVWDEARGAWEDVTR